MFSADHFRCHPVGGPHHRVSLLITLEGQVLLHFFLNTDHCGFAKKNLAIIYVLENPNHCSELKKNLDFIYNVLKTDNFGVLKKNLAFIYIFYIFSIKVTTVAKKVMKDSET
jgi:hypothetical protein